MHLSITESNPAICIPSFVLKGNPSVRRQIRSVHLSQAGTQLSLSCACLLDRWRDTEIEIRAEKIDRRQGMKLLFQCPCCSCFCFMKASNKPQGKDAAGHQPGKMQGGVVGKTIEMI
jgi:hypothetical protein